MQQHSSSLLFASIIELWPDNHGSKTRQTSQSSQLLSINKSLGYHELILQHHFSFRKKHSIEQQCHTLANQIKVTIEAKKTCAAVFVAIEQAFDTVKHNELGTPKSRSNQGSVLRPFLYTLFTADALPTERTLMTAFETTIMCLGQTQNKLQKSFKTLV